MWQADSCRVIHVGNTDYEGYCRVIWSEHVREMSDLALSDRDRLMTVVHAVEQSLRALMKPEKINLAAFGNQVPHLHWHVIARFPDDPHFPDPIWASRRRPGMPHRLDRAALIVDLDERLDKFR